MSSNEPFSQLTGPTDIYVGPVGETVPAVNATPAGNWILLGPTDGEQSIQHSGALTYFRDNDHQGPVKAVRPEEGVMFAFTVVGLTLENYARYLDQASDVTSDAGPPATKTLPLKRGFTPNEYALLFKGEADSPYGAFPAMYVVPRGVFDGEPTLTRGKDQRPGLECEFQVIEDDNQADANRMGWLVAQTA
jgi:hypothetical protein